MLYPDIYIYLTLDVCIDLEKKVHFIYSKTHIEVLVNKDYNKRGCLGANVKVKVKG
jgi:hypothetical protein